MGAQAELRMVTNRLKRFVRDLFVAADVPDDGATTIADAMIAQEIRVYATTTGWEYIIEILLAHRAIPNARENLVKWTALMMAAARADPNRWWGGFFIGVYGRTLGRTSGR